MSYPHRYHGRMLSWQAIKTPEGRLSHLGGYRPVQLSSRPPLARIMAIDRAIRSGGWPNAGNLSLELEVSTRTVRRDITYMRDRLGAPLEYDSVHHGYGYTEPAFRLSYFPVAEGELVALMLAQRVLRQYRGTPFEQNLRRAFEKLIGQLPDGVIVRLDVIADCLAVLPSVKIDYDPEMFAALARSVVERRRIEVVYHSAGRDVETTRTIDPYNLMLRGDDWYVVAQDGFRAEVLIFAVQRFRRVSETGETFDRPPEFRVEDYMEDSFGVVRGDGRHRVALRFLPPASLWVAEKRWHSSQVIESDPDGRLVLRLEVSDLREIARWAMSWGSACTVLEPEELKMTVARECRRILDGL